MRIVSVLVFFLAFQIGFSQTYILPDTNLRNKLIASYPQVMQGNALDTTKAAALTGTLNLSYANITNASGIQYFTGITNLNLTSNQLTTIPDISAITGLQRFYADGNQLTSLPSMATLTNLIDFQISNNELTALPNLSGATGLMFVYCNNNNISQLPLLTQFPQLNVLDVGVNPIGSSIDVSSCSNLTQLHVHVTNMDTIIGLENLKNLSVLYAWNNNIKSFKALDSITTLTICVIFNNPIIEIPYMQNKPNLNTLDVHGCQLTFENVQPALLQLQQLQQTTPATFNYAPQQAIPYANITARAGNPDTLIYPIKSPLSSNMYVWLKDSTVLDSSASPFYIFNPLQSSNAGNYELKVYNTYIPSLILNTNTFRITVLDCIDLIIPTLDTINKDCSKGYTINFTPIQVSGGTAPFTYEVSNTSTTKLITYPITENLAPGKYLLSVIDSKNCIATDSFTLNSIGSCDPVITPNGDGIMDTYFIEKPGKVSVYDLNRNLVNTLQAPIVWGGTDNTGALLESGLYILVMEGQKPVYLTIIR